jgi:hypothetical protein
VRRPGHDRFVAEAIEANRRLIENLGDGVMASFWGL